MRIFVAQIDVYALRLQRLGGDQRAFQHGMRRPLQDVAILEGARFAFIGIDHDVFHAVSLQYRAPFHVRGKTRPTEPAQIAPLDQGDHIFR